jgi:branched-chain amino acid transport system substrate-binding protein
MKQTKGIFILWVPLLILLSGSLSLAKDIVIGYSGPLVGVASEYGQDVGNGIEMAVNEVNETGGIKIKGEVYKLRLEKLDDRVDPTRAVHNARRFQEQGAIAIFNSVFTTVAPMTRINTEKGREFLLVAYTSSPKLAEMSNRLIVMPQPFSSYVEIHTNWGRFVKGWKTCATVITLGAYGDEWRAAFREAWERKGGTITIERPANYYTETDFSAPLTAALATKPDCLLVGGPSAPTALVIEQARSLGFKGGFILIDQAKQDYIAEILKNEKMMGDMIGVAGLDAFPPYPGQNFGERYRKRYNNRKPTWECTVPYVYMHALAKAIALAQTPNDVYKIREALPKVFPMTGDKYPAESLGMNEEGRFFGWCIVQKRTGGKADAPELYAWWPKSDEEFERYKAISRISPTLKHRQKWLWAKDRNY